MINKNKGFTLIELLLVISIISLLSTIFFYNTTEAKKKGEDAKMKVEAREVEKAIELYRLDNDGSVPDYDLRGRMVREGSAEYTSAMEKLVPKYLPSIPRSPSGSSYAYMSNNPTSGSPNSAVFVSNTNFERELCRIIGNYDFGQINSDGTCEGILADGDGDSGGSGEISCGLDPYISNTQYIITEDPEYTEVIARLTLTDPEGETPYINSGFTYSPTTNIECWVAPVSEEIRCSFYGGAYYTEVSYTIETNGCPAVPVQTMMYY